MFRPQVSDIVLQKLKGFPLRPYHITGFSEEGKEHPPSENLNWTYGEFLNILDTPRCTCLLLINNALKLYSVATRLQCNADSEEGQVHLGCALVYLPSSSSPLHRSCTRRKASTSRLRLDVLAILLVQLQLKSTAAKSRYTSATPRCTWT